MRKIENKCMLITYANSMGKDLNELEQVLDTHFKGVIEGVHILPFFPASGNRGFAVVTYDIVEPTFGTWENIKSLSQKYFLAADFMLNHVSIRCPEFQDYMEKGDESEYRDMFIHWNEFWPNGEPSEKDLEALYIRRPEGPRKEFTLKNGEKVVLWNTFFEEQVDINPHNERTKEYYERNLGHIANYVPLVRFDALAYASKVPGESCFFVEPEIWDVLKIAMKPLDERGTQMLAEIHENYHIQTKIANAGYWVYDFALPMLLLHGLFTGRTDRLIHWLQICPHNQFTTLDTHDGIGVVDVFGLLEEDEIELVCNDVMGRLAKDLESQPESVRSKYDAFHSRIKQRGGKAKVYQMGGTFYSAMGKDDDAYLLARIVQFFTPGIPQIYYVGFLAGESDFRALETQEGGPRAINRHNYTMEEIAERVKYPMLQRMFEIMKFRNTCDAFNGDFSVATDRENGLLHIVWEKDGCRAVLDADFRTKEYTITSTDPVTGEEKVI